MKNISLILNIVLLAAVVFLFVDRYALKNNPTTEDEAQIEAIKDSIETLNYDIAYINSDSLVEKYQFFIDKREVLEGRQQTLEREYRNRAQGLQKEIADFQQTAGNMTINQARAIEEDLVKKQENLMKYQENIRSQLFQEENKANQEVFQEVAEFLEGYGEENDLRIVLSYVYGGGILYADDALDVTNEVIRRLNEEYNARKKVE